MRIHFIGIDGISMSALAAIMQNAGHHVSGSDMKQSAMTQRLIEHGADFYYQQKADHIQQAKPDVIVYTAAIKESNEELIAARTSGKPVLERAVFLGQMANDFEKSIAVAGTHGKTSTTALLATVLQALDTDPTALVGGVLPDIGGNVRIGNSEIFLTEACEYVASFLSLHPYIGIILNVGRDHLDFYRDLDHIVATFMQFASQVKSAGLLILNGDDLNCQLIYQHLKQEQSIVTFGISDHCDWVAKDIKYGSGGSTFDACYADLRVPVVLNIPGEHSVMNALATIATCQKLGLDLNTVATALALYRGTRRRFEKRGELRGAILVDDYAHHPVEISTTLQAARDSYNPKRLIAVFQPHTYSRTKTLLPEFAKCFELADQVIITHTYAAREAYDAMADSQVLVDKVAEHHPNVRLIKEYAAAAAYVHSILQPGDLLLTLGAGPVDQVIDLLRAE